MPSTEETLRALAEATKTVAEATAANEKLMNEGFARILGESPETFKAKMDAIAAQSFPNPVEMRPFPTAASDAPPVIADLLEEILQELRDIKDILRTQGE